jgi:integrase
MRLTSLNETRAIDMKTQRGSQKIKGPWNKGKRVGQKLPLSLREIRAIRRQLASTEQLRNLALFGMAIESSLRSSDLLLLRVRDVAKRGEPALQVKLSSLSMNNPVQVEFSEETRSSLAEWIAHARLKPGDYLFGSRLNESTPISARHYARIVASWIRLIGLDPDAYGTESLRRTGPALVYKKTGDLEAVRSVLSHARPESTARYLGIRRGK